MPRAQHQRKSTSKLRFQCLPEPVAVDCRYRTCRVPDRVPAALADRSLITTYYLAATAREKLRRDAGRHDHRLSRLVGHAGLLDILVPEIEREELAEEIDRIQEQNKAIFLSVRNSVIARRRRCRDPIDTILENLKWNDNVDDDSDEENVYDESDDDISDDRSSSSDESEPIDAVDELYTTVEDEEASFNKFAPHAAPTSALDSKDSAYQYARGRNISWIASGDTITTTGLKSKQAEITISPITVMAEL